MPDDAIVVDGKVYVPVTPEWRPPAMSTTPVKDLPLETLAWNVSGMLGRDGQIYRAFEPDYELAEAIQSGVLMHGGGSPGSAPPGIHPDFLFDPGNPGHPQLSNFSSPDPTSYPYSAVVYQQAYTGANWTGSLANCSAAYVGAHTLVTAAHCVQQNGIIFGNWMKFTPAARGTGGTPTSEPYGQYSGCYDWWYPGAFYWQCPGNGDENSNGCAQYDYAVVDFRRCGNPTINAAGWMGVIVNDGSFSSVRIDGFPRPYNVLGNPPDDTESGSTPYNACGTSNNPSGYYPFGCGMTGNAYINGYKIESDSMTVMGGQSGGPWWTQLSGNPYCNGPCLTGVTTGDEGYTDVGRCGFSECFRNFGHTMDTAFWNFLASHSEL
jgi:hypothetical protein